MLVIGLASPVGAQPTPAPTDPPSEDGTTTLSALRTNLETAVAGYIEAEAKLEASKAKQVELEKEVIDAELEMTRIRVSVARYAAEAYRTGRLGPVSVMINAHSPDEFLGRAMALDKLAQYDQARLAQYIAARKRAADAKAEIDRQIQEQAALAVEMERRKVAAERALAVAGGTPIRVDIDPSSLPEARPAPRNPDGTWPGQGATEDDPTTGGRVTPRLLHAYNETKRLGWDWFVSCYRGSPPRYEHPKGRACDWSTQPNGFGGTAPPGNNKNYGDRLASFYVKNAKALGVMYVVWYCTIWVYGSGWRRYNSAGSRCGDSPSGDHTNHVHLSVY